MTPADRIGLIREVREVVDTWGLSEWWEPPSHMDLLLWLKALLDEIDFLTEEVDT